MVDAFFLPRKVAQRLVTQSHGRAVENNFYSAKSPSVPQRWISQENAF